MRRLERVQGLPQFLYWVQQCADVRKFRNYEPENGEVVL